MAVEFGFVIWGQCAVADVSYYEAIYSALNDLILSDPFSFQQRPEERPWGKALPFTIDKKIDIAAADSAYAR